MEIVRELAAMLPDGQIARVLNRLGLKTGRVNSLRHYRGIRVYDPETCKREGLLTLKEAAALLNVSPSVVGRLLRKEILPGRQVVPYTPWMIRAADLDEPAVQEYVRRVHAGRNAPQTQDLEQLTSDWLRNHIERWCSVLPDRTDRQKSTLAPSQARCRRSPRLPRAPRAAGSCRHSAPRADVGVGATRAG